jgi:hypothetical protein
MWTKLALIDHKIKKKKRTNEPGGVLLPNPKTYKVAVSFETKLLKLLIQVKSDPRLNISQTNINEV